MKILEGIGGERRLFHGLGPVECEPPDTIIVELPFIQRLRCYEDSILGFYNTGVSTTCDYVTTRINDINEQNNWVSIYPNPASSEINIEVKNRQGKNFFFSLVTIMGERIRTIQTNKEKVRVPLENIHSGCYFLYISDGANVSYVKKIIINAP